MANPIYATDLTDIYLGESTSGVSAYGGGGAGLGVGPDFKIQSSNALDKQITGNGTIKGAMYNAGALSLGANDHIFGWIYAGTPGIIQTLANGGKRMSIGTGTTNRNDYFLEGSDTRPEGGNKCYCVRYSTATPSPGAKTGNPGATPSYFGGGLHMTATSKGVNLGLDGFRYGTGIYITDGDPTTPATLAGAATQDELLANKWGSLFRVNGTYQWQGRLVIGQDASGTPLATRWEDTEIETITLTDTPHSQSDFTQLIVDHPDTFINLQNKTFLTLGTNNPGQVNINNASATSTGFKNISWIKYGTITGHANVPFESCTVASSAQFTQNGSMVTDCKIADNTASVALVCDDATKLSGGTITGCDRGISFAGAGPFTLNGTVLSDNIVDIQVNAATDVVVNTVNGAGAATIENIGAGNASIQSAVPIQLTGIVPGSRVHLRDMTNSVDLFNQINASATFLESVNYAGDIALRIRVRHASASPKYKALEVTETLTASGLSRSINQVLDE